MSPRLIINADDFGLTEGVSRGIAEAMRAGRVTSTTLMANRPGLREQVRKLTGIESIGVGVHLVLSSGRPVLPAAHVPSLVDETGCFPRDYRQAVLHGNVSEVKAEWRAQLEVALGLGLAITHLDSHHHLHLHPKYTGVAVELALEYSIGAMRSASPQDLAFAGHEFTLIISNSEAAESRRIIQRAGLKTVDRLLTGISALHDLPENFAGVAELCCHPGRSDEGLAAISSLTTARDAELEYLLSDAFSDVLCYRQVGLVHYGKL